MQWTWTIANLEAAVVFLSSYSAGAVVSPSLSLFVCVGSIRPDDLSRNATHKWGISILASLPPPLSQVLGRPTRRRTVLLLDILLAFEKRKEMLHRLFLLSALE